MSAQSKASELAGEILRSREYQELIRAKQIIDKNYDYKNKIRELKDKQADIKMLLSSNKQPDKSKSERLKGLYEEIFKNSDLKAYLDSERVFNEFIAQVFKIINDKIQGSL